MQVGEEHAGKVGVILLQHSRHLPIEIQGFQPPEEKHQEPAGHDLQDIHGAVGTAALLMEFDVTEALRYIEEKNRGEDEYKTTLFHCILMAVAKTVYLRPDLNRYISGCRNCSNGGTRWGIGYCPGW